MRFYPILAPRLHPRLKQAWMENRMTQQHEVSEGFIRQIGRNYFMRLVVDGQRKQRATGTNDLDKATELLAEWRAEERAGIQADSRLRYEAGRSSGVAGESGTVLIISNGDQRERNRAANEEGYHRA